MTVYMHRTCDRCGTRTAGIPMPQHARYGLAMLTADHARLSTSDAGWTTADDADGHVRDLCPPCSRRAGMGVSA